MEDNDDISNVPHDQTVHHHQHRDESTARDDHIMAITATPATIATTTTTPTSFADLGLAESLVHVCQRILSYPHPTPVQRTVIPYLLQPPVSLRSVSSNNSLAACITAATGSGKTASYLLPMIHDCMIDPTTIYAVILAPTRELATQIHQQSVLFTSNQTSISSQCVVGGCDIVQQANRLYNTPPHLVITTPGRFATILQNPSPPRNLHKISYCVIDEADRIFPTNTNTKSPNNCGFTKDMEIILQHIYRPSRHHHRHDNNNNNMNLNNTTTANNRPHRPRLLFYSATGTPQNYQMYQRIVNQYLPATTTTTDDDATNMPVLQQFIISEDFTIRNDQEEDHHDDNDTAATASHSTTTATTTITANIPNGLKQEYIFMPSQVRDAYLLSTIRTLLAYGGTKVKVRPSSTKESKRNQKKRPPYVPPTKASGGTTTTEYDDSIEQFKAQSAILFVSTCERAALVSELLKQVGVPNVALHSLVSTQQSVRNKALHQFQSEYVRIIVATDIAARGLDLPRTDLVINVELTRMTSPMTYIHRIGRTARAGRRGRAISFVTEHDVHQVQEIERSIGITLQPCPDVTDDMAMSLLSTTAKATRLAKLQLDEMNFHELVQKMKERKWRDQQQNRQQQA